MGLRRTIRLRVVGVVLTAFVVVVLLGIGVLAGVVVHLIRAQAVASTTATAGWIAEELADASPARVVAAHARSAGPERVIQILDGHGRLVAGSPAGLAALTDRPGRVDHPVAITVPSIPGFDSDGFVVVTTGARADDGAALTVVVAAPSSLEEPAQVGLTTVLVVTAVALILATGIGVRYAVGAALRPVDAMGEEVRAITDIGSSGSVAVPPGDDELSRLAATLNDLLRRLRAADNARRTFISDAGHELRSPLAAVRLSLDRLADPGLDREARARSAERAGIAVDRLSGVVEDVLALSRIDERRDVAPAPLDLDDLVLRTVRGLPPRSHPVSLDLQPVQVIGVADLLDKVVRNLLDNAQRHARSRVRVSVRHTTEEARLTVDNDGDPVPVEERERIFERFVRLDEARDRDRGGSGLGLSIVAAGVARHGGRVQTTDAADGWCRFEVALPMGGPADSGERT